MKTRQPLSLASASQGQPWTSIEKLLGYPMKTFCFALIWATIITLGSGVFADGDTDSATLNEVSGYRQWTRVNPDPVEVVVPVTRTAGTVAIDAPS